MLPVAVVQDVLLYFAVDFRTLVVGYRESVVSAHIGGLVVCWCV